MYQCLLQIKLLTLLIFLFGVSSPYAKFIPFTADSSDFPNPEKGFYVQSMNREVTRPLRDTVSVRFFKQVRDSLKVSMLRNYFLMDGYLSQPLSQSYLDSVNQNFQFAREGGFKLIPRFIYNRGYSGSDAGLSRILGHIEQLAPVLNRNRDALAFIEAGFIGMYGEWHSSDSGLDNPAPRLAILNKLYEQFDKSILINLRYHYHKKALFNYTVPLSITEAFTDAPKSRTGHTNDCLGADAADWGTYENAYNDKVGLEKQKDFLNQENRFVPQTGETCNVNPPFSDCPYIVSHLERMRWDHMNLGYHPVVLQNLIDQKCFDQVKRNLGYRLQLVSANLADTLVADSIYTGSFTLTNSGWGKLYKPRPLYLILRNKITNEVVKSSIHEYRSKNLDPRYWLKGDTITVNFKAKFPQLTSGNWEVLLHLPDSASSIHHRPEYSVRLANMGTWEPETGFNKLFHTAVVLPPTTSISTQLKKSPQKVFISKTSQGFQINLSEQLSGNYSLQIQNLAGRVLMQVPSIPGQNLQSFEVPTRGWEPGLYILKIFNTEAFKATQIFYLN